MKPLAGTLLFAGSVDGHPDSDDDNDGYQFEHSVLLCCELSVHERPATQPGHFLQASLYGQPGQFIIEGAGYTSVMVSQTVLLEQPVLQVELKPIADGFQGPHLAGSGLTSVAAAG